VKLEFKKRTNKIVQRRIFAYTFLFAVLQRKFARSHAIGVISVGDNPTIITPCWQFSFASSKFCFRRRG